MSAIVQSSDLFDFDGYRRELGETEKASLAWAQSTEAAVKRIRSSFDDAIKELTPLKAGLQNLSVTRDGSDKQITDYIQKLGQVGQQTTAARQSLASLSDAQQINVQVVVDLTGKLNSLKQRYDQLDPSAKGYQKQQQAILSETRTVTRAIDAQSKSLLVAKNSVDAAEGSYQHLQKQTAALRKELLAEANAFDLATGKINEHNRRAVEMQQIILRNEQVLKTADSQTLKYGRNVGNYPIAGQSASAAGAGGLAAGMAGKALGAGLALAGLDSVMTSLQKVGDITLQFDSLDTALKVVSNDTALYTQRQAMLKQVSENLGQDLATVEQTYTLLTASSKGTRLEGEATDKIFESVTGTMGRLKRPAEEVNRALLAVGQMMSKGTVQSEELKGQLGDVLPGAFNVAARSIGVTTAKLSEMLKNGEVVAADFLPKFAAELEKTFNPNNERRVEGLGANLARLRNEGVEWVKTLNIGDKAGAFIGNITAMGRSVREFFASPLTESTRQLAENTDAVKRLESQLPALLSRYDELKGKTKLSADEQRELQSIVNSLVSLAPSAATGFDTYGNALDINKGKVLSFTAAQKALNAELNKQVLADLEKNTLGGMQRATQTQGTLNRGTEQKSFNLTPYFLRSDAEKQQATDKNAGKRREIPLTDARTLDLQTQLREENKQIELNIIRRLELGGKLSQADQKFIDGDATSKLKQYKVITDYNTKIEDLALKAGDLLLKGDRDSLKKREGILVDLKAFEAKKQALINPLSKSAAAADGDDPTTIKKQKAAIAAAKKAQIELDRVTRESLAKTEAINNLELAKLSESRQDGLISEQDYIEKRLQITLQGANTRLEILEKANKTETDDYQKVLAVKIKAETDYKRSQLQLDLKTSKGATGEKVAGLDALHSEGGVSDLSYVDQRHEIIKTGLQQDLVIIKEAGQQQSDLYRTINAELEKEDVDYNNRKLSTLKKAWKETLQITKEALDGIDQQAAANYETALSQISKKANDQRSRVDSALNQGSITGKDANQRLHLIDVDELKAELTAYQNHVLNSKELTHAFINDRIEELNNWVAYSGASEKEASEARKQIEALEKLQRHSDSEDAMNVQSAVADNGIKQSDKERDHKKKNAEAEKAERLALIELVTKPVQGGFQIDGLADAATSIMTIYDKIHDHKKKLDDEEQKTDEERKAEKIKNFKDIAEAALVIGGAVAGALFSVEQQKTANELSELDRRHENELAMAGDNAEAKATIDKKYNQEKKRLLHQQDVQARERAVFEIAINTAVAVVKALPNIPLAIIIGALGALELGATLAAPLPAYKGGKKATDTYAGRAIAGEAGAELFVDREGYAQLLDQPTIINTKAGDQVFTANQTAALVSNWKRQRAAGQVLQEIDVNNQSADALRSGRQNEMQLIMHKAMSAGVPNLTEAHIKRAFLEAWKEAPRHETIIDADGQHEYHVQMNSRTEYLNKRYRLG